MSSPSQYNRARRGRAGDSLSQAGFNKSSTKAGMRGEKSFYAKAFQRAGAPLHAYSVWSSMPVPTPKGEKSYKSDVDFVIASGRTVVLVDVKNYAKDKVIWSLGGTIYYGLSKKYKASRNMPAALDRYRRVMPGNVTVHALVICAPESRPRSVLGLRWGSGIRTFQYDAGIRRIKKLLGEALPIADQVGEQFDQLLNGAEGRREQRSFRRGVEF